MIKIEVEKFIQRKFAEYYQEHSADIRPPTAINQREFGFLLFREKVMLRHKGFTDESELRSFLSKVVPLHAYYSCSYYESPEAEMKDKGWLGADLVFDVDADHIVTPCAKTHDIWVCSECGATGRGPPPERCPACMGQKIRKRTWLCEVCLEAAKVETMKLIDFLMQDFGFSSRDIRVQFSGRRGYHVHVENEDIRGLDQMARKEIVDYIVGIGLEPRFHGLEERISGAKTRILVGPDLYDVGWRGRLARGAYEFLLTASPKELESVGLKESVIKVITSHREEILESWKRKGPWGSLRDVGTRSWRKIVQQAVKKQSAQIDTVVTTDIHRLIRLNDTLHGKTGLKKTEVPLAGIDDFDPLKRAIAFKKGTLKVFVSEAPQFRLGDETYGPYKSERVELPTAAALLLLCGGAARVAE